MVHQQLTFMKCVHLLNIVTEMTTTVLFVSQGAVASRHNKLLKIDFPLTLMVYYRKISTFIRKQNTMAHGVKE